MGVVVYFTVRGGIVIIGITPTWWRGLVVLWVQSSCMMMSVGIELRLVWVASPAHFMAFGMVVGYVMWAKSFPCHLV